MQRMKLMNRLTGALIFLVLFFAATQGQTVSYSWPLPENWVKEIVPFPLKFAKTLDYPGVEEIHFMPGWSGDSLQEQVWSYMFVWDLDTLLAPDTARLTKDLVTYFNGLSVWVLQNSRKICPRYPVSDFLLKPDPALGKSWFEGNITVQDVFFSLKPMTLNFRIAAETFPELDRSQYFFLFSPKPFTHEIWDALLMHLADFRML